MKFYLVLLGVILLQGSIFSISLKESESLKLNLETKTETKDSEDEQVHALTDDEKNACKEEQAKHNAILCDNSSNPTTPTDPIGRDPNQIIDVEWTRMQKCQKRFNDVGVSSEGAIVGIGVDGKLYLYDYDQDEFELIEGDIELNNLRRVDIGYDGRIYVVNFAGDTYMLDCNRHYTKLPGCAIDIGTGRGHEVSKIGCDDYCDINDDTSKCLRNPSSVDCPVSRSSPYVYTLICKCDCRCCHRRCNIFVKYVFNHCDQCEKDIDRKCYWLKYPNGPCWKKVVGPTTTYELCRFGRIDTHVSGGAMGTAKCNPLDSFPYRIYQFIAQDKNVFKLLTKSVTKYRDLCGDNYGNIFYIKRSALLAAAEVYLYNPSPIGADVLIPTNFTPGWNISCGPYAQPTVTAHFCCMRTTSKRGYN